MKKLTKNYIFTKNKDYERLIIFFLQFNIMNYIISSIILLVVILVIIYLLSINNNSDKIKNKFIELYKVITSKKTNYLNNKDSNILLNFIKHNYPVYNNVIISNKIYYTKNLDTYILNNINMIGYILDSNNKFIEKKHILTIKFIPIKSELFVGNNLLFGINGNFYIETDSLNESIIQSKTIIENSINTNNTDVLDLIPDIIHLSSEEGTSTHITTITMSPENTKNII